MKKDGIERKNLLPFNPLLDGWRYRLASCCDVLFMKEGVAMYVGKHLVFKQGQDVIAVKALPENQLQFLIKSYGVRRNP